MFTFNLPGANKSPISSSRSRPWCHIFFFASQTIHHQELNLILEDKGGDKVSTHWTSPLDKEGWRCFGSIEILVAFRLINRQPIPTRSCCARPCKLADRTTQLFFHKTPLFISTMECASQDYSILSFKLMGPCTFKGPVVDMFRNSMKNSTTKIIHTRALLAKTVIT